MTKEDINKINEMTVRNATFAAFAQMFAPQQETPILLDIMTEQEKIQFENFVKSPEFDILQAIIA